MNYYYQLELLAGLFVMSSFLVAGALWSIVCEMKARRLQIGLHFRAKQTPRDKSASSIWRTP
jgi:hypothetical protein